MNKLQWVALSLGALAAKVAVTMWLAMVSG